MFDSIFIGMSGLQGFSKGLRVISNNITNLNTPGFKGETLGFADAFYQQSAAGGAQTDGALAQLGTGLATQATVINFQDGQMQQTGNALDLSISGNGFFVTQDKDGVVQHYTRDGQFQFDKDGNLVSQASGEYVMGYDPNVPGNALSKITLNGLRINPPKATSLVTFTGNLSSTQASYDVADVKLIDALGGEHLVRLNFKNKGSADPSGWTVTVYDGTNAVGSGDIRFINGKPDPSASSFSFAYTPTGGTAFNVKLDFSNNVTSFAAGNTSSLAVNTQDGYPSGTISKISFDSQGNLTLSYTNGQTAKGDRIALASFDSNLVLEQAGGSSFTATDPQSAKLGNPGENGAGTIVSGQLELSNVDLSSEFSNLIVMQRGYQACSNVVSTANDMLQQLFDMKGNR